MIALLLSLTTAAADPVVLPTAADGFEPVAVEEVITLQPFTVAVPHPWRWASDRDAITEGVLVTVRVDPELARPRQTESPVLYADGAPVERLNAGYPSGCVVGIIPGRYDPASLQALRLYFGPPGLPERIDADEGRAALAVAVAAGITPLGERADAREALAPVSLRGSAAVFRMAAPVVEGCSESEAPLAASWRQLADE